MRSLSVSVPKPVKLLLQAAAVGIVFVLLACGLLVTAWLAPMG